MHLKHLLISTVLFLLPVIHAAGIGEVNGANLALEEEANKDDSNVEALNAVNAVTNGKGIANDLATFTAAVASSTQNGEGTAATKDPGTEQTVVNGFASLSDALADYMSDLAAKVNLLTLQKAQISASLKQLLSNYNAYAEFIEGLVTGEAYKEDIDDDAANAAEKIAVAQDAFES